MPNRDQLAISTLEVTDDQPALGRAIRIGRRSFHLVTGLVHHLATDVCTLGGSRLCRTVFNPVGKRSLLAAITMSSDGAGQSEAEIVLEGHIESDLGLRDQPEFTQRRADEMDGRLATPNVSEGF